MDSATTRQCHCRFDVEESRTRFPGPSNLLVEEYRTRNGYPLPDEAASIESAMEQAKKQESLLSETIADLQSIIVTLIEEKSRIQGEIARFKLILRPVHKIPSELLGKIFSFTADLSTTEDPFQTPSSLHPTSTPWVLSQVCQPWRKLVLGDPRLWSRLSLALPHRASPPFLQREVYRLNLQLHRSADLSLDVIAMTQNSKEDMNPLLLLLCSQSQRWKTLHIELDDKDAPTLSLIRNHLPLLEFLHVRCARRPLQEFDCFEVAPRLRTLAVSGEIIQPNGTNLPLKLPNSQITHLRYTQPTSSVAVTLCYKLLKRSMLGYSLQTCRLSFHSESISRWLVLQNRARNVNRSLPLPFLTELELNHTEKKSGIEVTLSPIKARCLRIFTIFSTGSTRTPLVDFFTKPSLSPPFTPSPTSLKSLTIHRVEMPADEFSAVLDLLTGLEILKFGVQEGITNDYLELIHDITSTASFSIVPNLQTLALLPTEGVESQYDDEVLANLLELRWRRLSEPGSPQPDNRLLFVEVDRRILDETVRGRLDQLRGEGMRIEEMEDLESRTSLHD
ncbi:hypothetical protein L218DRAFT_935524 [Marasmius fiardii PR-910]|nr:hypothetical protein L218DRAFT_935524 [Marasmius fiardii PR-910]